MSTPQRPPKGFFGLARLPLAKGYPLPARSRRRWLLAGFGGGVALALGLGLPALFGVRQTFAPGPLSSAHARLEANCAACHRGETRGVSDAACLTCHERAGVARGSFDLARHVTYHVAGTRSPAAGQVVACAACHTEHEGRDITLTTVAAATCAECHGFGSFDRGHPEFAFAAHELPEPATLQFAHRHHVARVLGERLEPAAAAANPQLACFTCHEPAEDGTGFAPLEFARHCGACHLTGGEATPPLPRFDPARPLVPGLLGLAELQVRPAERWALFTDPGEFSERAGRISKSPLNHADPWVLANLRHARAVLYPQEGLAAALDVRPAGELDGPASRALFRRATSALASRAAVLRAVPDPAVAAEVRRIETLVASAERRLASGEEVSAAALLEPGPVNPALSSAAAASWRELVVELTTPCRGCHVVADGALLAVAARKDSLDRARFHHRAHYPETPDCTTCHAAIPDLLGAHRLADGTFTPEPRDVAATWNLPTIAVCRECHGAGASASACSDCHDYHPDTRFRPDLLVSAEPRP